MALRLISPLIGSFPITQLFGENPQVYSQYGTKGHAGIDYGTPIGTPVYASASGTVGKAQSDPEGYGNHVRLNHSWGRSIYAHFDHWLVELGQSVTVGQMIGRSGNSGNSTGPHLHFEIRFTGLENNGYMGAVNPLDYITGTAPPDEPVPDVPVPTSKAGRAQVTASFLNLRYDADVWSNVVGMLYSGVVVDFVDVVDAADGGIWLKLFEHVWCAQSYAGVELAAVVS